MVIRQNTSDCWNGDKKKALYNMKKSLLAVLWHCANITDSTIRHQYCPRINNSWCTFWGENKSHYIYSVNIPLAIHNAIKPIFVDLCSENLLKQSLHVVLPKIQTKHLTK